MPDKLNKLWKQLDVFLEDERKVWLLRQDLNMRESDGEDVSEHREILESHAEYVRLNATSIMDQILERSKK